MNSKTARKPAAMTLRNLFLGLLFFSLSTPGLHMTFLSGLHHKSKLLAAQ